MSASNIKHISCVIIVKDAGHTIKSTLNSLSSFTEVILYDNGSSDDTLKIAADFANVKLVQGGFSGFGETKNKAAEYASNDWILSLDADETLNHEFIESLSSLSLDTACAYQILRTNFYRQQEIKYCWKKERITRLYHRSSTGFNDNKVHEFVLTDNLQVSLLSGLVNHYPYQNLSDFMLKADRYSTLFAREKVGIKKSSPGKAVLNACFSFIKTYVIKAGFLDGYPGLIIAFSHMTTNFFKYMKLYEANIDLEKDR
ncbi:glycosyl transferase ['Osedax' symbiont bacterium Rs2_46_30_T18]|nr:glycosyl transferase ['Osedax' symbiont bacterium Rs2_46_30_T18]